MNKRIFDFFSSLLGLLLFSPIILLIFIISSLVTRSSGLFIQDRVGQFGRMFKIYKIKSMQPKTNCISAWGRFLRKSKLDELPQMFNILKDDMSFVGPRPDIAGYADVLTGKDREFLKLKPGLTGLASLKYRNEEGILAQQENPKYYNDTIIWPDKVRINNWYFHNRTLIMDLKIICFTVFPFLIFDIKNFVKTFES